MLAPKWFKLWFLRVLYTTGRVGGPFDGYGPSKKDWPYAERKSEARR